MKIEKLERALKLTREDNKDNFKKFYNLLEEIDKKQIKELGTRHDNLGEMLINIKAL